MELRLRDRVTGQLEDGSKYGKVRTETFTVLYHSSDLVHPVWCRANPAS